MPTSGNPRAWLVLGFSVAVFLLTSCNSAPASVSYQDPQTGISLTTADNWRIERSGRYLLYVVTPERQLFSQDSVRIEIDPLAISNNPVPHTLEESLESEIDRLNTHNFKLDELDVTQPISIIEVAEYHMATATFSVPTALLPDDSLMNQMGQKDPSVFQIIDVYIIDNGSDFYTAVETYKGKSDQLNIQADEIVRSIRFNGVKQP